MPRAKTKARYQGFALSIPFIDEIKRHIKDKDQYRSVTDYVRDAIRFKMSVDNGLFQVPDRRCEDGRNKRE